MASREESCDSSPHDPPGGVLLKERGLPEFQVEPTGYVTDLHEDITCGFITELAGEMLPTDVASQLYVVAREADHNAARHASPEVIEILLTRQADRLLLKITGDGGRAGLPFQEGLGILSMRYRTQALGGMFTLDPGSDGWPRVRCLIPYKNVTHRIDEVC